MNLSPLKYLDYDISLLLNDYVEKEIKKRSKIYHIETLKYINHVIIQKLDIKKINNKSILFNNFNKNDIIIANTIYYKTMVNNILKICSYDIIKISNSYIDNFFFTIVNLWSDIYEYHGRNPFYPIVHFKMIDLIKKGYVVFHDKFKNNLTNTVNILNNTMGIDKFQYLLIHHGIMKPFSFSKHFKFFLKEWCIVYFHRLVKKKNNKKIYEFILQIINDNQFPESNDYFVHYNYLKMRYFQYIYFRDSIYFFDKLWFYSGREIGSMYGCNSVKMFDYVDDYRYLMKNNQYLLKKIIS